MSIKIDKIYLNLFLPHTDCHVNENFPKGKESTEADSFGSEGRYVLKPLTAELDAEL